MYVPSQMVCFYIITFTIHINFIIYVFVAPCLLSPCINNGRCIAVNATEQLQCNCREMYLGTFCEKIDNVRAHIIYRQLLRLLL